MGNCYCERVQKPVPVKYGKAAQYPLTVTCCTPIQKWLFESGIADKETRGIEKVNFENGVLIINHTSYDYEVEDKYVEAVASTGFNDNILCGHNYVFLLKK